MGQQKRFPVRAWVSVMLVLALGACRQEPAVSEPTPLDFDNDPRILRGVWSGRNEAGDTLVLDLVARYISQDNYNDYAYDVSGTFQLNDEAPRRFSGSMSVPVVRSGGLGAQLSPTCGPFTGDTLSDAQRVHWELCGSAPEGSPPRFSVWLASQERAYAVTVTKQADEPALPADEDAPIRTDKERYTPEDLGGYLRYTVEATYTNPSDEAVHLIPCGAEPPVYSLQRFDGGNWVSAYEGLACPLLPAPTVAVSPGATFSVTLDLAASRSATAGPEFGTDLTPGVHRVAFLISTQPNEGGSFTREDLLPLEQRVSNAFELRAP